MFRVQSWYRNDNQKLGLDRDGKLRSKTFAKPLAKKDLRNCDCIAENSLD